MWSYSFAPTCNGKDRRRFRRTFRMHQHRECLPTTPLHRGRTGMWTSSTPFLYQSFHFMQWNSDVRCKFPMEVKRICNHAVGPIGARSTRIPAWNYVPQYTAMDGLNFRHRRRSAPSCKEVEFSHGVTRRWQSTAMYRLLESTTDLIYLASGETSIPSLSPDRTDFFIHSLSLSLFLFINLKRFFFIFEWKELSKFYFSEVLWACDVSSRTKHQFFSFTVTILTEWR
jgi:hypothetical protein